MTKSALTFMENPDETIILAEILFKAMDAFGAIS